MILKFYYIDYLDLPLGIHDVKYKDLYLLKYDIVELFLNSEEYIYLVEVDLNDPETSFEKCKQEGFRCSRINILEKYSLLDLSTYYNIGVKKVIIDSSDSIDSQNNRFIKFINALNNSDIELYFSSHFINNASSNDNIDLLNLYFIYGKKMSYDESAIDFASKYGNIKSLNWWLSSGLELKYSEKSLEYFYCEEEDAVKILSWWFESGLEIKYNDKFIENLSMRKYLKALDKLVSYGFKILCTDKILDHASSHGYCKVLDWWLKSGIELSYTEQSIDSAISLRNEKILKWWINSGLELKYTKAFVLSSQEWLKQIDILDYFK
ncbi:repeat protein [Moumouvirus goulette]|uniref:Repeat protein n=1 Tax=Moumouvirus goulette TaxID=1247379 RepID=M1PGJ1_9VIRU|nr:repeat protein [Moumouvirus goulette]AGF85118.1 repeat protein [Moumouvirus goulette]